MNTIVVGIDGSKDSQRALRWAIKLAQDTGAEIIAVHVIGMPAVPYTGFGRGPVPSLEEGWRDRLTTAFELDWCAPLRDSDVKYRTILRDGAVAPDLMHIAETEQADLIVVGCRGLGGFRELLVGSVTNQLTHHSNVPVAVIRKPRP